MAASTRSVEVVNYNVLSNLFIGCHGRSPAVLAGELVWRFARLNSTVAVVRVNSHVHSQCTRLGARWCAWAPCHADTSLMMLHAC